MIGKQIRARREELHMTQEELASTLGYKNKSSIAKIENGTNDIVQSKVVAFAKALNTTPAYLMGWEDTPSDNEPIPNFDNIIYPIEVKEIPLLGDIACGEPIYANEDRESYVLAGTDIDADFCLKAKGDSMIGARIYDGDIVFIKKQNIVDNGEIAAVVIDDEATLKRVYYERDKNRLTLQAEHPKYRPLTYEGEELDHIHILGKAIAFQSDII